MGYLKERFVKTVNLKDIQPLSAGESASTAASMGISLNYVELRLN